MNKTFLLASGTLLIVISIGIVFQPPYVSPEVRRLDDKSQLLRLILDEQATQIHDVQTNNPEPELYKNGITILRTQDLDGLNIPTAIEGIPINIIGPEKIDRLATPIYSTITINVHGSTGDVTIDITWDIGGIFMSSGLTLYCSKTGNAWKVDSGRGYAP